VLRKKHAAVIEQEPPLRPLYRSISLFLSIA